MSTTSRRGKGLKLTGPVNRLYRDLRWEMFDLWFNKFLGSGLIPRDVRSALYKFSGFKIDGRANIYPGVRFRSTRVSIGRQVMINEGVHFDNVDNVFIGDCVSIGHQVLFITSTHDAGEDSARAGRVMTEPISIEAGCWVGARVTVLPGVVIRKGCVIAAGAVVVHDTDPHGLYAGIPATRIRDLTRTAQ